jgi:hypothetical protein
MGEYFRTGQVIDSDYIDALHVIDLAKYKSADSSKAIDGNFYRAHLIGGF